MFAQAGLPYAGRLEKVPNSLRALMLGELARTSGRLDALHPKLFDAYWARGRDLGDEEVLIEEGNAAGLERSDIIDALHADAYLDAVEAATQAAVEIGVTGVPAWVVDRRVLIPGAQPHDVFERLLTRLGYTPVD